MNKKGHWGFLAGLCGIFVFYLTAAVIVVALILGRIEAETNGTANLFGTWYQTFMFVADLVFLLGMIVCIIMSIVARRRQAESPKEANDEKVTE